MQTLPRVTHDPTRTRARRGLAILAGLLLTAALIFNLDVVLDRFRGYVDVVALVSQTSGVRIGSPVWVAGIEAGRVTAIDFMALGGTSVLAVHVRLEDRVRDVVRKDSRSQTARDRFIGEPAVRISAGSSTAPPVETGDTLYPRAVISLDTLLQRGLAFPEALDSLRTVLGELSEVADDRHAAVTAILDRLSVASAEASTLRSDLEGGSIERWLRDPELGERATRLRLRVAELSEAAEQMQERYGDPELRAGADSVATRAQRLGVALERLEAQMAEGRGFIPRAAQDSAITVAIRGVQAQVDSLTNAGLGFALRMILP